MKIVIYGLTITSSWGNGHATTYRSLGKALKARGHEIHFIEKDVEWYRSNRDLPNPDFCTVHLYEDWARSQAELIDISRDAEAVVVGSYFSDAIPATHALLSADYGPLLFYDIDTPVTMSKLRTYGRTDYLAASLIPYYAAYLSFTGGPTLDELESHFHSPYAAPFYCSVDADLYRPTEPRAEYQSELSYLGTFAADRQEKLIRLLDHTAALLPEQRFLIAGPQYPDDVTWQANVERIIHLAPPEHPAFYSSSRFTLNLTRQDMVLAGYSPSVRLFEASACGSAILSDTWEGLEEFLTPGEEILHPCDAYETRDILKCMPEADRLKMGRRARERVLSEHTSSHRAVEFEHIVDQCSGHSCNPRQHSSSSSTSELTQRFGSEAVSVSKE